MSNKVYPRSICYRSVTEEDKVVADDPTEQLRYRGAAPRNVNLKLMVVAPVVFGGAIYGLMKLSGAKSAAEMTGVFGRSRVMVQAGFVTALVSYIVYRSSGGQN